MPYNRTAFQKQWRPFLSEILGNGERNNKVSNQVLDFIDKYANPSNVFKKGEEAPILFFQKVELPESKAKLESFFQSIKEAFGEKYQSMIMADTNPQQLNYDELSSKIRFLRLNIDGPADFKKSDFIANKMRQTLIIVCSSENYGVEYDEKGDPKRFLYEPAILFHEPTLEKIFKEQKKLVQNRLN